MLGHVLNYQRGSKRGERQVVEKGGKERKDDKKDMNGKEENERETKESGKEWRKTKKIHTRKIGNFRPHEKRKGQQNL